MGRVRKPESCLLPGVLLRASFDASPIRRFASFGVLDWLGTGSACTRRIRLTQGQAGKSPKLLEVLVPSQLVPLPLFASCASPCFHLHVGRAGLSLQKSVHDRHFVEAHPDHWHMGFSSACC